MLNQLPGTNAPARIGRSVHNVEVPAPELPPMIRSVMPLVLDVLGCIPGSDPSRRLVRRLLNVKTAPPPPSTRLHVVSDLDFSGVTRSDRHVGPFEEGALPNRAFVH